MSAIVSAYPNGRKADDDLSAVKTLGKALALLDAFASAEQPLSIAEVALRAKVTRPTAHRIIQTLIADGYLAQNPIDGRVTTGYSVLELAARLLDTDRTRLESLPHLENLARATGERVMLGILHRHRMLYLAGIEKPSLPTVFSRFGETVPAYCSAVGKAYLAHMPEVELAEYLSAVPLIRRTDSTLTDEATLRAELAEVRRTGIAIDRGEHLPTVFCIGAPIIVRERLIAAAAVVSRSLEPILQYKEQLRHTVEVISHMLGRGV